jgi:hypothetical protein
VIVVKMAPRNVELAGRHIIVQGHVNEGIGRSIKQLVKRHKQSKPLLEEDSGRYKSRR